MMRNGTNNEQWKLAKELVDYELSLCPVSTGSNGGRHPVIEKLLPSLIPLVGKTGLCSLLARALTLAKRESPELRQVRVREDCTLEGLADNASDAVSVLIAHLIGLMTTFMGETLTLRLVRNAWPELRGSNRAQWRKGNHE